MSETSHKWPLRKVELYLLLKVNEQGQKTLNRYLFHAIKMDISLMV